jgi:hypothetical protein
MSRFIDPTATRRVDLGLCDCPGTPHGTDWADIRDRLSGIEVARFGGSSDDEAAGIAAGYILAWSLLDDDGEPVAITGEAVALLDAATMTALSSALGGVVSESVTVPNGSGAPSRPTSRASASRTRTTRVRR